MKFIIDNWYLIFVAAAAGGMLAWPLIRKGSGAGLSPAAAVQLINREKAVVVDVSEADEFAAGHVAGARHIPVSDLEARLPASVKNKALPVIFVCAKGPRGARALGIAKKLGYEKAHALAGGLAAWKEANLPVEKA